MRIAPRVVPQPAIPQVMPACTGTSGLPRRARAGLLSGFYVIAARAIEDEKPGVRSHPRDRADQLHRRAAMRARRRVVVTGRRGLSRDRIALLCREAIEKLAERLFARKFCRELRFETAAVESNPQGSRPPLNLPHPYGRTPMALGDHDVVV